MEHSNAYYVIRGIARGITKLVIAGLILTGFYVFILAVWSLG
jgi:hypothetical protein